jgi:hypothetical protein
MPRATLWSYHPYLMKALNQQNNQKSNNTTLITLEKEGPPYQEQEYSSNFRH